ncbi:MAG: hypothetical protein KDK90_14055 [Leptospiraceae bacterium]|nr:hypothetical protein [Leptospiraceae bacterium]
MHFSFSIKLNSLKTVLTSTVILIIVLLTFILTFVSYFSAYDAIEKSYINQMQNFNSEFNRELDSIYQNNKSLLSFLSKNKEFIDGLQSKNFEIAQKNLENFFKDVGGFENVFISTPEEDSMILVDGIGKKSVGIRWGKIPD